jgi:hypothetical protein
VEFNHFTGTDEQRLRDGQSERPRGLHLRINSVLVGTTSTTSTPFCAATSAQARRPFRRADYQRLFAAQTEIRDSLLFRFPGHASALGRAETSLYQRAKLLLAGSSASPANSLSRMATWAVMSAIV